MKKNQNKFDATEQSLGRLASTVSLILQGKHQTIYQPNICSNTQVIVYNLAKAKFTGNKLVNKKYYKASGYPSGIKPRTMKEFFDKDPRLLFKILIYNMLPKNKLRKKMMDNLKLFNRESDK